MVNTKKKKKAVAPKVTRVSVMVSPAPPLGTPVFLNGKQCGTVESIHEKGVILVIQDSQAAIELMHGAMGLSIGSAGSDS